MPTLISIDVKASALQTQIAAGYSQLERQVETLELKGRKPSPEILQALQKVDRRVQDIMTHIQLSPSSVLESSTPTTLSSMARKALIQNPEAQRALCSELDSEIVTAHNDSWHSLRQRRFRRRPSEYSKRQCCCRKARSKSHYALSLNALSLYLSHETSALHQTHCPFKVRPSSAFEAGLRLTWLHQVLSCSIHISIALRTGNESISLSPCLTYNPIVSSHSEQFRIINLLDMSKLSPSMVPDGGPRIETDDFHVVTYRGWLSSIDTHGREMFSNKLESVLKDLIKLFCNGCASPFDVDERGRTLLTVGQFTL